MYVYNLIPFPVKPIIYDNYDYDDDKAGLAHQLPLMSKNAEHSIRSSSPTRRQKSWPALSGEKHLTLSLPVTRHCHHRPPRHHDYENCYFVKECTFSLLFPTQKNNHKNSIKVKLLRSLSMDEICAQSQFCQCRFKLQEYQMTSFNLAVIMITFENI